MVKHKFNETYSIQGLVVQDAGCGYTNGKWQESVALHSYTGLVDGEGLRW